MALMIPDDIEHFKTEGEERFYAFLRSAARPDDRYIAWYLPDIQGREPDFLLFAPEAGLVVLEVKDWALEQIREADPHTFVLDVGGHPEARKNPYAQAREYFEELMGKIREDDRLLSKDPKYYGKPRIPLSFGVVFPNINRYEYEKQGLDAVIDPEKVFFWDDLHPESPLSTDRSGKCFAETIARKFPPPFPFTLNNSDLHHVRRLIFPSVKIVLPERRLPEGYRRHADRIRMLDHHQEAIARKFDGGHRILTGPSGSGKTLVLVHKADSLLRYNPSVKRILFLCFNITLVSYIKRLLSAKKVPLGPRGVEVFHFYELCARILGEEVHYEKEDQDYYRTVTDLALEKLAHSPLRFDAILIDEGQDFSDDMYRIAVGLLNPRTDSLTIGLDDNQNIYRHTQSWKEVGIHARGRVHRMATIYRNTEEIIAFAARVTAKPPAQTPREESGTPLFHAFFEYHGPKPQVTASPSFDALVADLADTIEELREKEGIPYSEMAILYTVKSAPRLEGVHIPVRCIEALEARGIMSTWISEDYRSKKSHDITTDRVSISTIHSSKGLDYAVVLVVGLDLLEPGSPWDEEQIRSLTYVALTRARYYLFVPYIDQTGMIDELLQGKRNTV